jgi:hypothetical protein
MIDVQAAAVVFVQLPAEPSADTRPWDCPEGKHRVDEVVETFDNVDVALAVAVGFNRQALRAGSRRWALLAAEPQSIGVGSVIAPPHRFAMHAELI